MKESLRELVSVLKDPELPYGEWGSQASALHARMPQRLDSVFEETVKRAQSRGSEFPSKQLQKAFERFLHDHVAPADADVLRSTLKPLTDIMEKYSNGLQAHELNTFVTLFEKYYEVESIFSAHLSPSCLQSPSPARIH